MLCVVLIVFVCFYVYCMHLHTRKNQSNSDSDSDSEQKKLIHFQDYETIFTVKLITAFLLLSKNIIFFFSRFRPISSDSHIVTDGKTSGRGGGSRLISIGAQNSLFERRAVSSRVKGYSL